MRLSRDDDGCFFGVVMEMKRGCLGVTQDVKMHARIFAAAYGLGIIIFVRISARDVIHNLRQIEYFKLPLVIVRSSHLRVFIDVFADSQRLRTVGVRAADYSAGYDIRPRWDASESVFHRKLIPKIILS